MHKDPGPGLIQEAFFRIQAVFLWAEAWRRQQVVTWEMGCC